ncbi:HK97-gp10 family putative phage morphogenesis protein [Brevundimonas naejangsanensis]|uniref:HK97-gp10 family putative phage morphogenesis protein n=1 Tax=Brevundimonas naejangsanensis TaxID=588932 RepID=UPI0026EBD225|nr:HK97-gp10 family putative phage morphogenesis protein [Brevundimonas naejangsanensis]
MTRPLNAASRAALKKRMLAVPPALRAAAEAEMSKQADRLVSEIRAAAPVKTGELAGSIQKKPLDDGRIGFKVVGGERGKKGWYIRFVEHGTKASPGEAARQNRNYRRTAVMTKGKRAHAGTPAQPFFWPTWRRNRRRVRAALGRALKKAAKEV